MNAREELAAVAEWLGWQHEDLSYGLKSAEDALKLHRYWQERADLLPEFSDEEADDSSVSVSAHRIAAVGYDPLESK